MSKKRDERYETKVGCFVLKDEKGNVIQPKKEKGKTKKHANIDKS